MDIKGNPTKMLGSILDFLKEILKGVPAMYIRIAFFIFSLIGAYLFNGSAIGKLFIAVSAFWGSILVMLSLDFIVRKIINWRKNYKIKRYIPNIKCEKPLIKIKDPNYPQIIWVVCYENPEWEIVPSLYEVRGKLDPKRIKFGYVICAECGALFKIGLTTREDAVLKCIKCGQKVYVRQWFSTIKEIEAVALTKI